MVIKFKPSQTIPNGRILVHLALLSLIQLIFPLGGAPHAQELNPYLSVTDPRGISYLNTEDSELLWNQGYVDGSISDDSYDSSHVIAAGSGSGIITHIWTTTSDGHIDTNSVLRLWVDDSLVLSAKTGYFFARAHQRIRPPFDTVISGGYECDVQIPFKHNFRITHKGPFLSWKVAWRPVRDSNHLSSFARPSLALDSVLTLAESRYRLAGSPWAGETSTTVGPNGTLTPGDTLLLVDVAGSGWIKTIHFSPILDRNLLQNLRLQMFWDNEVRPSVDVPLGDFFGAGAGMVRVNAFQIRSDSLQGLTSYLPMPFYRHARLQLINLSNATAPVQSVIAYGREPVDPKADGYFGAEFHESIVTRDQLPHPVVHVVGEGKYVGCFIMLPDSTRPQFMEGDIDMLIDSDYSIARPSRGIGQSHAINYAGIEDYCDGGWYFVDGAASSPFGGCARSWSCLYRFHYLDAISFRNDFSFLLEHGNRDDFRCHMRTVGFYYFRHAHFWTSRDTIGHGETWTIGGSGYQSSDSLAILLGSQAIYRGRVDSAGEFRLTLNVPSNWAAGSFLLQVNAEQQAHPILVLQNAALVYAQDSVHQLYAWRDSIDVSGYDFQPYERINLFVDTALAPTPSQVTTDSVGVFHTKMYIPWLPDGMHLIHAQGSKGSDQVSRDSINVTRTLRYEFEDLMPPSIADGGPYVDYVGWHEASHWGNQSFVFDYNLNLGTRLGFNYNVPYTDTFVVIVYATTGLRYGNYEVFVDGSDCGLFTCFRQTTFDDFRRSDPFNAGTHSMSKGVHSIEFVCKTKDPNVGEADFAADDFFLIPKSAFHPLAVAAPVATQGKATLYPNPVAGDFARIDFGNSPDGTLPQHLTVKLYDMLGRDLGTVYSGSTQTGESSLLIVMPRLSNGAYELRIVESGTGTPTSRIIPMRVIH